MYLQKAILSLSFFFVFQDLLLLVGAFSPSLHHMQKKTMVSAPSLLYKQCLMKIPPSFVPESSKIDDLLTIRNKISMDSSGTKHTRLHMAHPLKIRNSYSSPLFTSFLKASVSPQNEGGAKESITPGKSIIYRVYKRSLGKILQLLKNVLVKLFKKTENIDNDVKEIQSKELLITDVQEEVSMDSEKTVIEPTTTVTTTVVEPQQKIEEDIVIINEPKPVIDSKKVREMKTSTSKTIPNGQRWAIAAPNVDLTGNWKIFVDDSFKEQYDTYLKNLGQPSLVRSIAVSIVELTTEEVIQENEGRELSIKGKNLRGAWDRTLVASGSDYDYDFHEDHHEHNQIDLITADKEKVKAEAWWEENGTVHRSYLRGVKKYGGGDFESRRYLEDDGNTLICESEFHPKGGESQAVIKWTFKKIS